jgi:protein-tyrosine phosphatase
VPDFGVPTDRSAFTVSVNETARRLCNGESILLHCGAGIGRTGMFAICVLLALGMTQKHAQETIANAGSSSERREQDELVSWFAAECA